MGGLLRRGRGKAPKQQRKHVSDRHPYGLRRETRLGEQRERARAIGNARKAFTQKKKSYAHELAIFKLILTLAEPFFGCHTFFVILVIVVHVNPEHNARHQIN